MSTLPVGTAADRAARLIAFAVPAALLGGAYIGQYAFHLVPCEMCWWQRWAHFAALALAAIALFRSPDSRLVRLVGLMVVLALLYWALFLLVVSQGDEMGVRVIGVVLALGIVGLVRPLAKLLVPLAATAILIGGLLGAYHAGIEYGWWEGLTACTSETALGDNPLDAIMNAPLNRCDRAQWTLFGISLAGFNFLISVPAALQVFALLRRGQGAKP